MAKRITVKDKKELIKKLNCIAISNPSLYVFYKVLNNNTDESINVEVETINALGIADGFDTKYTQNGYELYDGSPFVIARKNYNLSINCDLPKHSEVPKHQEYLSTEKDEYEIKCDFAVYIINEFTDMYNRGTLLCGENVTSDDILSQIIGTIVKTAKLHKLTEEELK